MSEDTDRVVRMREASARYRERNREKERERQRLVKEVKRSKDRQAYNAYQREWNAKNKDRINSERREKRAVDPEYAEKVRKREREGRTPERTRAIRLKGKYGLSLDDYEKMYQDQNGNCAICGAHKPSGGRGGLSVDHCHSTGKVRKLLCTPCNTALGKFKDNVDNMRKAINYILEFQS